MTTQKSRSTFLDSIQALRAIAFLGIFTYHCGLSPLGPWAVCVFFIISGFCLYISCAEKGFPAHSLSKDLSDALHRVAKLYPVHIAMMLFVLIRRLLTTGTLTSSPLRIVCDALLLTSWFPPAAGLTAFNGVAWYLSTSLFHYCCFGTIQARLKHFSVKQVWSAMLAAYVLQILTLYLLPWAFSISDETLHWFSYEFPLFRLGDFFLGCCLGAVYTKKKTQTSTSVFGASLMEAVGALFILLTLLVYALNLGPWGAEVFRRSVLLIPCAALTVYLFIQKQGIFTKLLSNRILLTLAELSAVGFLIHQVIIYQTKLIFFGAGAWVSITHKIVVCLVAFAVTCLLSLAVTRLFRKKHSAHQ